MWRNGVYAPQVIPQGMPQGMPNSAIHYTPAEETFVDWRSHVTGGKPLQMRSEEESAAVKQIKLCQKQHKMTSLVSKFITDERFVSLANTICKINQGNAVMHIKTYMTLNTIKMGIEIFGEEVFCRLLFKEQNALNAWLSVVGSSSEAEKIMKFLSLSTGAKMPHRYPAEYDHQKICKYFMTDRISSPVIKTVGEKRLMESAGPWQMKSLRADMGLPEGRRGNAPVASENETRMDTDVHDVPDVLDVPEVVNLNSDVENTPTRPTGGAIEHSFFVN